MPELNWDIFTSLPGSTEKNFELVCRGIVRHSFGSFGTFHALANQPGVEFHLKLDKRCDALGEPGHWWGWQCKWYDLPTTGALGSTRRAKIVDGLCKTEEHLPGLTDWVLWTRRTLTKDDQWWFNSLSSKMVLHLWTGDEVNNLLAGQAAVLRGTYFGELVLTPDILRERHAQAVAPIRARWQPNVHHVGDAERELRRMFGEVDAWSALRELAIELRVSAASVTSSPAVPTPLAPVAAGVVATAQQSADALDRVAGGIGDGDLDLLRDELAARPRALPPDVATAPGRLRASNQRAGLYATNAVAGCHDALHLLDEVAASFSSGLVAVLAPAGCGKTHLAAQLTAGTTARPPGLLLHGRDLHASHTLDDLARRVSIAAQPTPSMEALLAAVDAAGQRARTRLPVFIDGLNESEDPRAWKPLLAELDITLAKYPYVMLACTLRPDFVEDALPDGTRRVEIGDYGNATIEAVLEHFQYWKIDSTDAYLPNFLSHPLTLRLFCEVTNPSRQASVGVGAMPRSLTSLFERFLEQVAVRVAELAPRTQRFYAHDVNVAIAAIAIGLWESRTRGIASGELRTLLNDAHRPWDQSIVRALEHEGVLLRMPSKGGDTFVPVYDLLGGHIIGNALLAQYGESSFETWINHSSATTSLAGDYNVRHPLADDILVSLVEQVPRRFSSKQVWQVVEEPLRARALRMAAYLEPASLDVATVDALLNLVRDGESAILEHLWQIRGAQGHPLNAEGLDRALRGLAVSDRDLRWTEWLRRNLNDDMGKGRSMIRDLEHLETRWRGGNVRGGDRLRARWVMWTLTSTVRRLRDQATRALYWFGRTDPEGLFSLTLDSLAVNDSSVGERMLAAAYGVVMSHQHADAEFANRLGPFVGQLASAFVGPSATAPTQHYLARLYVRGIVAFTTKFYPASLPAFLALPWSFAAPHPVQPIADGDAHADEAGSTMRMDYENYTLGRLFDNRANHDMGHAGHKAAVAHVRGVVWMLGWRAATFEAIDQRIAEDAFRYGRGDRTIVERYGKKYGWIGFYTYAGLLEDSGRFPRRDRTFSDVDIDPSFPEPAPIDGPSTVPEEWLVPTIESHETWVRTSETSLPFGVLRRAAVGEYQGPWIAVHGQISAEDRVLGRYAWAYLSAMAVAREYEADLVVALQAGSRPWCAREVPSDDYIFAGEIPWHAQFAEVALPEDGYSENVQVGPRATTVEALAHDYAWESYHSEMNRAGTARVPSKAFSERFDLRGVPQSFDQILPDGSRASITLSGVDGLEGDVLYLREDLVQQYLDGRAIVWCAFGERELRPFPSAPPQWLKESHRQQENAWSEIWTEMDLKHSSSPSAKKGARRGTRTKAPAKKATKQSKRVASAKAGRKSKPNPSGDADGDGR